MSGVCPYCNEKLSENCGCPELTSPAMKYPCYSGHQHQTLDACKLCIKTEIWKLSEHRLLLAERVVEAASKRFRYEHSELGDALAEYEKERK